MSVIEIQQLTKHYKNSKGISDITLVVHKGEIMGFVGPNGSGKTTTIKCMMDFLKPNNGHVKIFDQTISKHGSLIKNHVGYVPANIHFDGGKRVRELLAYNMSFYSAYDRSYLRELCQKLEINVDSKAHELSTGEQKKLALLLALSHKPQLLILDEPTSGLDVVAKARFLKILKELNQSDGVTIFLSSHNLSEIQTLCNRVAILDKGHLIDVRNMNELMTGLGKIVKLEGTGLTRNFLEQFGTLDSFSDTAATLRIASNLVLFLKEIFLEMPGINDITIENVSLEDNYMAEYIERRKVNEPL